MIISVPLLLSTHHASAATTTGVLVPLYTYPDSSWDTVTQAKTAHPSVPIVAIINPNNGPGSSKDANYVSGTQTLQSAGVVVIGYVYTGYGSRSTSSIDADINSYKNWYSPNGIFFDEMSNAAGDENYYSNLSQYAKSQGLTFTVGNPGTDTLSSYIGTVDNIVIYESGGLPSISSPGGWYTSYDKSNFSTLSYGVSTLSQSFLTNESSYVGYTYVTNDNLPNPWDSVPSYFGTLVADLDTGSASPPTATALQLPTGTTSATTSQTYMQDTTSSSGQSSFPGRPIQEEDVTSSSGRVGKQIDTILIKLKKGGSPTGNVTIGVFNTDLSVKKIFATKNVSTLTTSYTDYTFSLSSSDQLYQIQVGDRIGIKYAGGSSSNSVSIMRDTASADPFDGTNSYYTYYTTAWNNVQTYDLYMTLKVSDTLGSFVDSKFSGGLNGPTAMEFAPDGRLFVTEKGGALKVIKNGVLLPTPFLSVSVDTRGERGLESVTFDPNFVTNGYVYVYYTTSDLPNHNRVSRFTADPVNPDIAIVGSEVPILNLENLTSNVYHNGGALHFGKDGKLYVAVGENGNSSNSQTLTTRLGKILRINSNGSIPSDNPFFNVVSAKKEIWSLGLRNPFTFAFSPAAGSTLMHINDVGQNTWEEVNLGISGANYGWPTCEGVCVPTNPNFVDPIYTYNHNNSGAAITGGVFYESTQFPPEYNGSYFFGDYVVNFIKRLTPTNQVVSFLPTANSPIDLDVGSDGSLYYLSNGRGEVHKVQFVPGTNHFPHANATATPMSGDPPLTVTFDGSSSTDPDPGTVLSYSWNFGDGFSDSGVSVKHVYQVAGPIVATLTVSDGNGGTDSTSINISVGTPPTGTINTPVVGTKYNAGDTISFNGSGTDTKDGSLQASAFKWVILFHHNTHTHPFLEFNGVKNGSFTIPILGETSSDVWYRIYLTVTDSLGLNQTSTRDVIPNKSTITLASNVPGLLVYLDGQPQTTPTSFVGVVGINRALQVPGSQIFGGNTYKFQSWSDGGAQNHTISTPSSNTTYTATSIAVTSNPVTYMSDTTASSGQQVYSTRPSFVEYVGTGSVLVGKQINSITIRMHSTGSPVGIASIGIINPDTSIKQLIGTIDVTSIKSSYADYTFSLGPSVSPYTIQAGDRIGLVYRGGTSSGNNISIMRDTTNAFDGTNSYMSYYTTKWNDSTTIDLYMTLKLVQ